MFLNFDLSIQIIFFLKKKSFCLSLFISHILKHNFFSEQNEKKETFETISTTVIISII